ncbi:MAG: NfeD family protein [Phycisphaerae bacterium]|nr:NfeD family protein [Phycisphaerae bacterium]MDD5381327.1 NfeD family protein [Phycisphaerae bacterium]
MKKPLRKFATILLCLLFLLTPNSAFEPNSVPMQGQTVKAVVIVCKGMIDNGLYKSIERRTQIALDAGAEYLIYEISTYGGLLQSADDISKYFILDVAKKAHTVAYITTEAISAGAMISVSCQDIIMRENTTIGDCAPIQIGAKLEGVEREKTESFTRAAFKRAAEANGYPDVLLKAMVTMQTEVYRVKNLKTGKKEFFEGHQLPDDKKKYDLDNKELVVKNDELLTLTASQAFEYGIARSVVGGRAEAMDFLAKRDGVIFAGEPISLETSWSEEMVRWLNSPAVMGVLVMLALLGVYIEFNTPGVGLPGLAAVICFAIIIGSKYLVGMANWVEVALFVIGLLLLMIEIFVLPGFGVVGFLGIIFILAGLFGMLVKNPPDKMPWPQTQLDWQLFNDGVLGLVFGFVGFAVLAWILTRYLPKLQFLSGLILIPTAAQQGGGVKVSMTAPPDEKNAGVNVGDIGEVVSTLRPAGKAKFGYAIVDVLAEAEFLDRGTKVEIIEIHGNRVVVRAAKS